MDPIQKLLEDALAAPGRISTTAVWEQGRKECLRITTEIEPDGPEIHACYYKESLGQLIKWLQWHYDQMI